VGTELAQKDDRELMELVKTGDFGAFDEIYRRYSQDVRRFLYSLWWDEEAANDATQEVFYRLYRARESFEPGGKLSSWLFHTAKNYFVSQCRKDRSNGKAPVRLYEGIRAGPSVEPDIYLLELYRRHSVRRAIAQLPPTQRVVFVLAQFEDLKYAEISEKLGIPVGTVKSRMFAAVASLRRMLEEHI
jgi:RNA polymerase sigma-70 factor (ECF subfamily)